MKLILFVTHWSLLVALICSSCIIFTLATAELSNLEGRILQTNSSIDVVKNETLSEEIVSPPIVPLLVDVIHGKVNSVIHEIHGSIEEIPIIINTEVKPDDSFPSATVDLTTPVIERDHSGALEGLLISEERACGKSRYKNLSTLTSENEFLESDRELSKLS